METLTGARYTARRKTTDPRPERYLAGSGHNRYSRLPKPTSPVLRLNTICPYFTMFPLDFPFNRLQRATPGDWVLDPFCGRGTTNFAARLRGLPSVGVDSNPVASAIAEAKFLDVGPRPVISLCKEILASTTQPSQIPTGEFWEFCFAEQTLVELCKIREYLIEHCSTDAEIALRALMLGILHGPRQKGRPTYLSNQMPRTYATKPDAAVRFWKERNLLPQYVDVLDAVSRRANFSLAELPPRSSGYVYEADSRSFKIPTNGKLFRWVITSPPYLGMRTYRPDQWLRNWFLGGPSTVAYSQEKQLGHHRNEEFVRELAKVWANIASVCEPGARMIIRFGALPSCPTKPGPLLKRSLQLAECGWRVVTIRNAGRASHGRRQAEQFNQETGEPVDEIDLYAVLER
ncbi:MAG: DNA modification methylase [Deltaproteobacteria bacterium]|nr:MAG: DNA modification methylase [Deltaproteobacteria bacterium]